MKARSAQEIWEAALGELQIQVNKQNYRTWLTSTVGLSYQDGQFVVGVPNTFIAEYLDKNQRSLIEKTLIGLIHDDIAVHFQTVAVLSHTGREEIPPPAPTRPPPCNGFNPKYTFQSFIVGNCNRLAHASALGVADNPALSYNPLFICGGVGLGKTHLLHAIGHVALASNIRVLYASAEQFTNEFVNAVQERKMREFRNKYRSVDMLLIDDIHFIIGKEQTEESFFHTFNELHNANRQIVITSDLPPKFMPRLEDRLRSRFEWGLIVDTLPPDFDTRLAILRAKAAEKKVNVGSDVLEFIAHRDYQNVREMEGCLNRVIAFAQLIRAPLTLELATQALGDLANKNPELSSITPGQVIEAVANSFQLTPSDLKSRKRDREIVLARQVAIYLIRQKTRCSLAQVGKELGGRNHSTIIHSCEKVASDIASSPSLQHKLLGIQQIIHRQQT
ncbi:chromosomal replication initiator protein DnaA [Chloroflexota bacterium]